jgi:hypothetical protein
LASAVQAAREAQILHGILLPDGSTHQLIVQYADHTNLTLLGTEANLQVAIVLLDKFGAATGLQINWSKSTAYWFSPQPLPHWVQVLQCAWALPGQAAKFLGIPFGLDLHQGSIR